MSAPTRFDLGECAELQRQGAKAAARGDSTATNPMLRPINRPSRTGESDQLWSRRRDAWQQGYELQWPAQASVPQD